MALATILAAGSGCATWQAARLYESGTRALDGGRPVAAVEDLERAAALAPHASEIRNHLGLAYTDAGRPEAARRAFEQALELDCGNEQARRNLAALQRRAGEPGDGHGPLSGARGSQPAAVSRRPDAR